VVPPLVPVSAKVVLCPVVAYFAASARWSLASFDWAVAVPAEAALASALSELWVAEAAAAAADA